MLEIGRRQEQTATRGALTFPRVSPRSQTIEFWPSRQSHLFWIEPAALSVDLEFDELRICWLVRKTGKTTERTSSCEEPDITEAENSHFPEKLQVISSLAELRVYGAMKKSQKAVLALFASGEMHQLLFFPHGGKEKLR